MKAVIIHNKCRSQMLALLTPLRSFLADPKLKLLYSVHASLPLLQNYQFKLNDQDAPS